MRKNSRIINYNDSNEFAIIIGHTEKRGGATVNFGDGNITENQYNLIVAEYLYDIADVYIHDHYNSGYRLMCKRTANRIKTIGKKYKLILSLHFNAAHLPIFHGCMALYYGHNEFTRRLAHLFGTQMENDLGLRKRHPKALLSKHDRGFWEVAYPSDPVLLLEPFIATSPIDRELMNNKEFEYSKVIRKLFSQSNYI